MNLHLSEADADRARELLVPPLRELQRRLRLPKRFHTVAETDPGISDLDATAAIEGLFFMAVFVFFGIIIILDRGKVDGAFFAVCVAPVTSILAILWLLFWLELHHPTHLRTRGRHIGNDEQARGTESAQGETRLAEAQFRHEVPEENDGDIVIETSCLLSRPSPEIHYV